MKSPDFVTKYSNMSELFRVERPMNPSYLAGHTMIDDHYIISGQLTQPISQCSECASQL